MADERYESWPLARRMFYPGLIWAFRHIWGLEAEGLQQLPAEGPVILAGNHVAMVDGAILVLAAGTRRYVRPFGKAEVYRVPLVGWWLRAIGTIPLDRGRAGDVGAMRLALDVLGTGGCMALFPEGRRNKTGDWMRPKAGVGFLAARSGALVVPLRISGTERWPFSRVRARFGEPLRFEGNADDHAAHQAFAERVMRNIFAL